MAYSGYRGNSNDASDLASRFSSGGMPDFSSMVPPPVKAVSAMIDEFQRLDDAPVVRQFKVDQMEHERAKMEYERSKMAADAPVIRLKAAAAGALEAMDKDARDNPDGPTATVMSYDRLVGDMVAFSKNPHTWSKGKAIYDRLEQVGTAGVDRLDAIRGYRGLGAGDDRLSSGVDAADRIKERSYRGLEVTVAGKKMSAEQMYGGGGYASDESHLLFDFGFDGKASSMYLDSSDPAGQSLIRRFVDDNISGADAGKRWRQNAEAGNWIAGNRDRMSYVLDESGAMALVDGVRNEFRNGGMTDVMDAYVSCLESAGERGRAYGTGESVRNMMSSVGLLKNAVFGVPEAGKTRPPEEERENTLLVLGALQASSEFGTVPDFGDPRIVDAARKTASIANRVRADGGDLFGEFALSSGFSLKKELGMWFSAALSGKLDGRDGTVLKDMNDTRALLTTKFGNPYARRENRPPSGAGGYYDDPANQLGYKSDSVVSDCIDARVISTLWSAARGMNLTRGMTGSDALDTVLLDSTSVECQETKRAVSDAIAPYMLGNRDLADGCADFVQHSWNDKSVGNARVSDFIVTVATSDADKIRKLVPSFRAMPDRKIEKMRSVADTWVRDNVLQDQYSNVFDQIQETIARRAETLPGGGLDRMTANAYASSLRQTARNIAKTRGSEAALEYLRHAADQAVVYGPMADVFDDKGNQSPVKWDHNRHSRALQLPGDGNTPTKAVEFFYGKPDDRFQVSKDDPRIAPRIFVQPTTWTELSNDPSRFRSSEMYKKEYDSQRKFQDIMATGQMKEQ